MYRHLEKCRHPSIEKVSLYTKVNENCYQCNKCSKEYPYRASVLRHVSAKDCRRGKEKKQCDICAKEFMYPSQLARHRKMYEKEVLVPSFLHSSNLPSVSSSNANTSDLLAPQLVSTVQLESSKLSETILSTERDLNNSSEQVFQSTAPEPPVYEYLSESLTNSMSDVVDLSIYCSPVLSPVDPIKNTRKWKETLVHTEAAMAAEADVCYSLLTYLKSIKKQAEGLP